MVAWKKLLLFLLLVQTGLSDTSVSATPTSLATSYGEQESFKPNFATDQYYSGQDYPDNGVNLSDENNLASQLKQSFQEAQNYKPGTVANFLGQANGVTQAFRQFSGSPKNENLWKKLIKFPVHALHATASPLEWTREKLTSLATKPTSSLVYSGISHNIPWDKLNPGEEEMAKAQIQQASGAATGWGLDYGSNFLVDKFGSYITNNLLGKIISTKNLPDQKNELAYKNEVVRRILESFDGNLPSHLQNGKAYEYYLQGKKFYGQAKLVYTLIDNVTSALSLGYQFTIKAQLEDPESLALMQTKLAKVITVTDIMRRCADSYLAVNKHFKLDEATENKNLKTFNRWLSIFSGIARYVCPWRDAIAGSWATGKGMVQMHQAEKQQRKVWKEQFVKRFGLREDDAEKLHDAINPPEGIVTEEDYKNLTKRANKILLPYGLDLSLVEQEVEQDLMDERSQKLFQIMTNKYHMRSDDAQKFAQAESEDEFLSLLQKYGINPQTVNQDPELMALADG